MVNEVKWFFKIRIARKVLWFRREVVSKHFTLSKEQEERFTIFVIKHFVRTV